MAKKVFIIGLDGGPYREVKEWIEEGRLPFLSGIAEEGVFGRLESIIPPYTMLAWPVICTGKNPAKIGPFLYKSKEKGFNPEFFSKSQFINSTDIRTWSIWEWASRFERKVGVVNVPMTYPPREVNGFMVTGFFTPRGAKDFTHPPELGNRLKDYRIDIKISQGGGMGLADRGINRDELLKDLRRILEERTEYVLDLIGEYTPEFYIMNFKEVDNFMHYFWDKKELVLDYFRRVDRCIERIYEKAKPDNIIIISDHGFAEAPSKFYHINQYLENRGYLKRAEGIKGKCSNMIYKLGTEAVKKFSFIKDILPDSFKLKMGRESIKDKIDWDKTRAYAHWYAGIYLNPAYYKEESDRKKGAEDIKRILLEARDPESGENIFLKVNTRWELFKGPYFAEMPDVVYTTTSKYRLNTNLPGKLIDRKFIRTSLVGHHLGALDGIIFIGGKDIKNTRVESSLPDVFPTACAIAGLPVPDDIDGRILKEAMKEGSYKEDFVSLSYETEQSEFLSEAEDSSIKEHLKDLGYL